MIQPKLFKLPLAALSAAAFSLGPALVAEEGKFLFINADPDPVQITLTIEKARPGHRRSRSGSFDRSIRAGWGAPDKVHPVSFQVPLDERPVTVDPGDPVTLYVPDSKPNHLFQVVSSTRKDQKRLCSLQTRGGHTVLTIPDHENRPIQRVDQVRFSFGDLDKASRAGLPSLGADSGQAYVFVPAADAALAGAEELEAVVELFPPAPARLEPERKKALMSLARPAAPAPARPERPYPGPQALKAAVDEYHQAIHAPGQARLRPAPGADPQAKAAAARHLADHRPGRAPRPGEKPAPSRFSWHFVGSGAPLKPAVPSRILLDKTTAANQAQKRKAHAKARAHALEHRAEVRSSVRGRQIRKRAAVDKKHNWHFRLEAIEQAQSPRGRIQPDGHRADPEPAPAVQAVLPSHMASVFEMF